MQANAYDNEVLYFVQQPQSLRRAVISLFYVHSVVGVSFVIR